MDEEVTSTKLDWKGEQVKEHQKRLKFDMHAGHLSRRPYRDSSRQKCEGGTSKSKAIANVCRKISVFPHTLCSKLFSPPPLPVGPSEKKAGRQSSRHCRRVERILRKLLECSGPRRMPAGAQRSDEASLSGARLQRKGCFVVQRQTQHPKSETTSQNQKKHPLQAGEITFGGRAPDSSTHGAPSPGNGQASPPGSHPAVPMLQGQTLLGTQVDRTAQPGPAEILSTAGLGRITSGSPIPKPLPPTLHPARTRIRRVALRLIVISIPRRSDAFDHSPSQDFWARVLPTLGMQCLGRSRASVFSSPTE
jgi:hypothetical protein